ncbi:MAG: excinuclease ABC subunit UvrA [Cyclobacteriaceae bacterium]
MSTTEEQIEIYGAREHNLKDVSLNIPRNKLVVITGVSGSGKSSLAFDTIYAEGQRRYMESFSAYARSFLGNMERPDVDKIDGLSPVISIEQKTTSKNPRSTVGTLTEIYDFFRLLYARSAHAYSYVTGERMIKQSETQIIDQLFDRFKGKKLTLLAPQVKGRKGHYRELFVQIRKWGYAKVRVDGELMDLIPKMQLDRYKTHDIEIVIDRIVPKDEDKNRLVQSVKTALKLGKGIILAMDEKGETSFFSKFLMCPTSGIAYDEPAPNFFSFNSPYGACQTCNGLGKVNEMTKESIIPKDSLSIRNGAIAPIGSYKDNYLFRQIDILLQKNGFKLSTPVKDLPKELMDQVLFGSEEKIQMEAKATGNTWMATYEGIMNYLEKYREENPGKSQKTMKDYIITKVCESCNGDRLKKESLHFRLGEKNISDVARMDVLELDAWVNELADKLDAKQKVIAQEVLKEITKRIQFLLDVGLDYLSLDRPLRTLSGGEAQRIRLATQIGTQLTGVLYIMDEPSIGLHQRDNEKLIQALKDLRDIGNSVIVVEHDKDMMLASDYVIDIGPGAGRFGGNVIAQGSPEELSATEGKTIDYLQGKLTIPVPAKRRKGNGEKLVLKGATGHNLKDVTATFPLGKMICVTGVSGSGKSSLIHGTLYPLLMNEYYHSNRDPLAHKTIKGLDKLDKVIEVDQSPIGRTPRSNPATYTGVFSDIRTLFTQLPESKIRGYKPGRFSFNVKSGRCETCEGAGLRVIEMDFLPSIHVPCETCKGKRYNRETLEIRYKGKSIADVLDMTVNDATEFFEHIPFIARKVKTLQEVGLGYITLGQHATTLSGGEAQRVKLATELSKKDTGQTFYILDEPSTGLHFEDINMLLTVLNKLVDKGNTVLIIEHNMDIIKVADHIIDVGVEGGNGGGQIIAEGTPEKVAQSGVGYTARFLKKELESQLESLVTK